MLTKNEITSLNLSPTKKDFVQIWNELLDVASKLSERWDPTSTNESDPGIVILKALTGIADKLNYNIDKNILEAFMPTAAQEESMRKLCDMLGYSMKYYQSAETTVNIKYYNIEPSEEEAEQMNLGLYIPKFTVITNSDQDISYFTLNDNYYISSSQPTLIEVPCMEGQLVKCESANSNNVISVNNISENNRFYLPETRIAENGIFVYNVNSGIFGNSEPIDGTKWTKVDNLNVQARGARVFKFGFDSYESRPYIEFPEDYSELFNEGIFVYYTRTNGVNGNISPRTLTQLELPSATGWDKVSIESFSVENVFSATSGANAETIKQAYQNFKKTIGTFETLVTCRDYMNKIYSMVENGKPLVSNILVTDIRKDINKAVTICSCDDAGILYKEHSVIDSTYFNEANKPIYSAQDADTSSKWHLGTQNGMRLFAKSFLKNPSGFKALEDGTVSAESGYWVIKQGKHVFETVLPADVSNEPAIDHFDIVFYPFKAYKQITSNVKKQTTGTTTHIRNAYDASFTYSDNNFGAINGKLDAEGIKTIAHNIKKPVKNDIVSINNYLRLNATIATNAKVSKKEGEDVVDNIKIALANAFNMRELDFGDEIPFDSILEVIENADPRIRAVSLNDPDLYTTFSVISDIHNSTPVITEYAVASRWLDLAMAEKLDRLTKEEIIDKRTEKVSTFDTKEARAIYNKLAVRNVLAGRVPLFNYNNTFTTSFSESAYTVTSIIPEIPENLPEPTVDNPYTMWTENDITYTGRLLQPEEVGASEPTVVYTKTAVPEEYKNGILTETIEPDGTVADYITDISATCEIAADNGVVTNLTLAEGEFVKFRAPNFTTIKTYPAYVNYNLMLANSSTTVEAKAAEADTLFSILNSDVKTWTKDNTEVNWQKVIDYFSAYDENNQTKYKKSFEFTQQVSVVREEETDKSALHSGQIVVNIEDNTTEEPEYSVASLLALSGCVKLANKDFTAEIEWKPADGETAPASTPELTLTGLKTPFISNANLLARIKEAIDTALAEYGASNEIDCSFEVKLTFECVPFEAKSLQVWESFIKACIEEQSPIDLSQYSDSIRTDSGVFWRAFGEGYDVGKYVLDTTQKLLKFDANYFGLLPETYLAGIYLIKNVGEDRTPVRIKNNEEYKLRKNERLCIEYTPSKVTEDGQTETAEPITEVYGEGTIIRANGFEAGLVDSSELEATAHKSVVFQQIGSTPIALYSLGANEQIEIRDLAKVELTKDSFTELEPIYMYKNFNGCPELENIFGNDGVRTYTLKEGEYIFYTDQNQLDFAFFGNGTQVTLAGNITLPEFDIIELSVIFESGIQEIPWAAIKFRDRDKVTFQEFQYVTLGQDDTINEITLESANKLDNSWQYCTNVSYTTSSDPDTTNALPTISLHGDREGNGWEACSILELNVTPNHAQTLRSTDKVKTKVVLSRTSAKPAFTANSDVVIEPLESQSTNVTENGVTETTAYKAISFKTNLACQACGNSINIENVYSNPDKLKGFQVKVFAEATPEILNTASGSSLPTTDVSDIATWAGDPVSTKEYGELWNQLNLDYIKASADGEHALGLAVNLLPNTYGVFCIYINYTSTIDADKFSTWIEVTPGTNTDDVTLLNVTNPTVEYLNGNETKLSKLYLKPGINCIRVNKTGKIFVKASEEAQGVLYFDELRLVNSELVEYTDSDKNTIQLYTKGLNLEQIGYLDAADPDDTKVDEATRDLLHTAYVSQAFDSIKKLISEKESTITDGYDELVALRDKANELVNAEKRIAADIEVIKSMNSERLSDLVSIYNTISSNLAKETALLDALNNNDKADDLEGRLATLLEEFTSIELTQKQLTDELAILRTKATEAVAKVSNKNILADFRNSTNSKYTEKAWAEVKTAAINNVENHYQERLTEIANSLDQKVNSAGKNTLTTILNTLRANKTAEFRAVLQAKVAELTNLLETDVDSLIVAIEEAANIPDYQQLLSLLIQLRNLIDSRDVKAIVSEIAQAVSDSDDVKLKAILEPLFNDAGELNIEAFDNITNNDLVTAIDTAYDIVKTNITSETIVAAVTKAIGDLKDKVSTDHTNKLKSLFADINAQLKAILTETSVLKVIDAVELSNDNQVDNIITQLNLIITERNDYIGELTSTETPLTVDNWSGHKCADFVREAILSIWSKYFAAKVNDVLDVIDTTFNAAIEDTFNNFNTHRSTFDATQESSTKAVLNTIDITAFKALFEKIETSLGKSAQKEANITQIATIAGLVQNSDEVVSALGNLGDNTVIKTLIADWQSANDVIERQKLQNLLKEALTKAISDDNRLFSIIADLLCPNIANIESKLDASNEYYKKLFNAISTIKQAVLEEQLKNLDIAIDGIAIDNKYLELIMSDLSAFKDKLADFIVNKHKTLMPNDVVTTVEKLKSAASEAGVLKADCDVLERQSLTVKTSSDIASIVVEHEAINNKILPELVRKLEELETKGIIDTAYEAAFKTLTLENQLLAEIRSIDVDRDFYYNVPTETSFAIELNESSPALNTLMNPAMNYDINNINNSFVISKLDIDYLDSGIQIARSSRLN